MDKKIYVSDFETTTIFKDDLNDETLKNKKLEVWLSGYADIDNIEDRSKYKIFTNIKDLFVSFIDDVFNQQNNEVVLFYHNLKFDGSYILHYFNEIGLEYETFINDVGAWYSIIFIVEGYKIEIRDSLKILNFSLDQIGKEVLKSEVIKGDTPLLDKKPKVIKKEWLEYIKTDLEILGKAIKGLFYNEGFTKFTSASESLKEYKEINTKFNLMFPHLTEDIDSVLRKGYRGGWTFVNPNYQEKLLNENILVYDKNSMYPAIMLNYALPYGQPKVYDGYIERKKYSLYVYVIKISFDIKENHLPTIQIKDKKIASVLDKRTTDYLYTSDGFSLEMVVTNYDLDLIVKHYDCDIEYIKTFEFQSKKYMFHDFIEKFSNQKIEGKKEDNYIKTQKAKLMLNSLYGKFGSRVEQRTKTPYIVDGVLKFKLNELQIVSPVYLPVAMFVTSIGRYEVITDAQKNYDYFLYSDTDSIHLLDHKSIDLPTDKYKFGYWDLEAEVVKAIYLRSKLYMEELKNGYKLIRGAGMTDEVKKQVTFDNFKIGAKFKGKKESKQIKGGVLIYDTEFTIKDLDNLL